MFPVVTGDDLIPCDSSHTAGANSGAAVATRRVGDHVPISSVALPVATICHEKNKVALFSGAASSELTGKQCSVSSLPRAYC
jgi:hypothetical protein